MEMKTPYPSNNQIELPLRHYREEFNRSDPWELSVRTGVPYTERGFELCILGQMRYADWPEFAGAEWDDKERILFLRYLLTAKKVSPSNRFVSYSEMPWGEVYDQNFRGRCVRRLVSRFGTRPDALREACLRLGGSIVPGSGLICEIPFMPELKLRLILWEGDDEFPASGQILFSDNFPDAFAAEDRVIVCELVLAELQKCAANLEKTPVR